MSSPCTVTVSPSRRPSSGPNGTDGRTWTMSKNWCACHFYPNSGGYTWNENVRKDKWRSFSPGGITSAKSFAVGRPMSGGG